MDSDAALNTLAGELAALTPAPQHPALRHLVESLQQRYADCVTAVLFYGSCLRSGDPYDGLVDLYLIVDNYRCANHNRLKAILNRLLPPNVFYAEFPFDGKAIRCKYAILTLADFDRGTSRWFQSYLWGRFSQPTAVAWTRDSSTHDAVDRCMAQAIVTFISRALPSIPAQGSAESLWKDALQLSYGTELRPESTDRARQLAESNARYYREVSRLAAPLLGAEFTLADDGRYHYRSDRYRRASNRWAWRLRALHGKWLSLARLSKALFTFEGGLDYAAWKLERHSGETIEIPDRVRRFPLIFVWGMVWRLYRRGVFR